MTEGFIDLQVNGGGGVLFNNQPNVDALKKIVAVHKRHGTGTLFPTLISDKTIILKQAIEAVKSYIQLGYEGVGGIHFEGPFISKTKPGIHCKNQIRAMTMEDLDLLTSLNVGQTIITLAPENVSTSYITRLVDKGVIVSLGHSNASFRQVMDAFDAGASMVTHLFNAMSQMQSRAPGLVGAALTRSDIKCSIIVDGYHVHDANVKMAYDIKGPEKLFLVSDAMPIVGTKQTSFKLYGKDVFVKNGQCLTKDGTLAGSALTLRKAVTNCIQRLKIPEEDAVKMATPNI